MLFAGEAKSAGTGYIRGILHSPCKWLLLNTRKYEQLFSEVNDDDKMATISDK